MWWRSPKHLKFFVQRQLQTEKVPQHYFKRKPANFYQNWKLFGKCFLCFWSTIMKLWSTFEPVVIYCRSLSLSGCIFNKTNQFWWYWSKNGHTMKYFYFFQQPYDHVWLQSQFYVAAICYWSSEKCFSQNFSQW